MAGRTFVMIKPDGVRRFLAGKIISRFEEKGMRIVQCRILTPTKELAESHYDEHRGKDFFGRVIEYITSGPVWAMTIEGGDQCVSTVRRMIGDTFPENAAPGTIRGDFGITRPYNVIHSSDSTLSAEREITLWFGNGNNNKKEGAKAE